jgi:hypothetical protein
MNLMLRLVAAIFWSILFLVVIYVVLKLIGFSVASMTSFWVTFPLASLSIFVFVLNEKLDESLRQIGTAISTQSGNFKDHAAVIALPFSGFLKISSNQKAMAIFLSIFLLWAICGSLVDWLIPPDEFTTGICGRFAVDCVTEDLNLDRRMAIYSLVEKVAAAIFVMLPFLFKNQSFKLWITDK